MSAKIYLVSIILVIVFFISFAHAKEVGAVKPPQGAGQTNCSPNGSTGCHENGGGTLALPCCSGFCCRWVGQQYGTCRDWNDC
ncbi:Antimicrobial peptide 2 [Orchesella cincta]|uniref:Antimicrobial peptide 2 n=1 Tax=Orchesella cincta TaxID=48709 RepID=A0A1D2M3N7_ORCCI|nr:Antimicrobial peptide 2 [Orchesella cincta]